MDHLTEGILVWIFRTHRTPSIVRETIESRPFVPQNQHTKSWNSILEKKVLKQTIFRDRRFRLKQLDRCKWHTIGLDNSTINPQLEITLGQQSLILTSIPNTLYGSIDERGSSAVGIEVDDIELPIGGPMRIHQITTQSLSKNYQQTNRERERDRVTGRRLLTRRLLGWHGPLLAR
jgi:hypothetical protein